MCIKERERLTTIAKRMTESLLQATDLLGGIPWKLVHEKHGISLFQADDTSAGTNVPCNVHAVCKFACEIEDVAASLVTPTTVTFKRMMSMLSSDFLDGAVVQNIVEPTPTNPHRYVALKWAAFKSSSPFAKDRDMLMLEYVDMIEDAQGQMTAFRIMESVDTPAGFSRYAESSKYTRDLVPLMGIMYHSTKKVGELRLTYTCNFSKNGDLPARIANSAIQSHVEKCINGILKYTENFRAGRVEIVLPQQVIPMSEQDHCRTCAKKFCVRRRRYNCHKCGEACCSSCCSMRTAHVPIIGERQLRVCTVCVIEARRSSRISTSGIGTPAKLLNSHRSNHFIVDMNESSRALDREQSFSAASPVKNEEVLERRSLDSLLDPVRSRLIEYKTFSSGNEVRQGLGVPKISFPGRSFSDGLIMRNKSLFKAKRRGSPADLAISIDAFRLYQMRMGTGGRNVDDGFDEYEYNTDCESTTSSSSLSPKFSLMRTLHSNEQDKAPRSRIKINQTGSPEVPAPSGAKKLELNQAMRRAKNIVVAANYANQLANEARKHHRILELQQEHELMASMLRNGGNTIDQNNPTLGHRPRHHSHGSELELNTDAGAILYCS
ncbi:hypothetical protein PsorP6_004345 [Peronosclerospora sorghi]|uniref:Uncharacterized protein n=1 Tax=Peronosclerospora sorghi TaxID=230839 RepID=A0ACC0VL38_9STRA|nr:hypothetical protein PsorP6_004345 [Peronosclerospora sorghi]